MFSIETLTNMSINNITFENCQHDSWDDLHKLINEDLSKMKELLDSVLKMRSQFATMQLDIMLSVELQYLEALQSLPTVSEGDKLHSLTLPSPVTSQEHSELVIKKE